MARTKVTSDNDSHETEEKNTCDLQAVDTQIIPIKWINIVLSLFVLFKTKHSMHHVNFYLSFIFVSNVLIIQAMNQRQPKRDVVNSNDMNEVKKKRTLFVFKLYLRTRFISKIVFCCISCILYVLSFTSIRTHGNQSKSWACLGIFALSTHICMWYTVLSCERDSKSLSLCKTV